MRTSKRPFFGHLLKYLEVFTPKDFGDRRPFALELDSKPYGLILEPGNENISEKLRKIEGVRLRSDRKYIVLSNNDQWIARNFYWFALRSLRHNELRNLWALFHCVLNSRDNSTSAEGVANLTGNDLYTCKRWLDELANKQILIRSGNKYVIDYSSSEISSLYAKYTKAAPTSTEELIMGLLCSNYDLFKGKVCDLMLKLYGLEKSAVYKALGSLKNGNYVTISSRHVGKRGPARDYLYVNCQNCFFLFASQEECLEYEFKILDQCLEKNFARKLEDEEKVALLKMIKTKADAPQLLRILNLILEDFGALKEEIAKNIPLQEAMLFLEKEMNLTLTF
jgi:hypothetical protein